VNHKISEAADSLVSGPNLKYKYKTPKLVFRKKIGPSISTPIFVGNKLIAAGYHGIYLFQVTDSGEISLLAQRKASAFESTPVVYDKKIFIGSRDGFLYCFGE
jgi:outer membrane protein assembly factor BamB